MLRYFFHHRRQCFVHRTWNNLKSCSTVCSRWLGANQTFLVLFSAMCAESTVFSHFGKVARRLNRLRHPKAQTVAPLVVGRVSLRTWCDGWLEKDMQKELFLEKDKRKAVGKANDACIFPKKDASCNFVTGTFGIFRKIYHVYRVISVFL
jgi:hypothetical protein